MSEERFDFRSSWGLPTKSDPDFELSDLDPEVPEGGNPQATQGGPERQKFIEFYNPLEHLFPDEDDAGAYYGQPDKLSMIPGIRFPQVATIAEQDVGNFLTIPANIAAERLALGGDLVSWSNGYTATDKDIADVMQRTGLQWNERAVNKLMASTSPEDLEAQAIVYARRQQREEQLIADNPGLAGFGLRILVNIGDPTFIAAGAATGPVIAARIANSATKTGAAIRFASEGLTKGERFKVGALTALAVDVPIETANLAADPARDPLMTAGFLAFTPILGGALNQLGRTKSDLLMDALNDLDEKVAAGIRGTDGGAMGAAQSGSVPRLAPEDDIPGAPAREGKLTFGTPLNFLARSADPLTRSLSSKLSWNPWTNRKGNGAQSGTAAEAQRRMYNAQSVRIRVMRTAAKKYFQKKGFSPSTSQIEEFMSTVGQVLAKAKHSTDPDIRAAVDEVREGFADGLAMVKDRNYIPGGVMDRPTTVRPKDPPDGGSSPTPARASQDAEPTSAPSSETPEVPEVAAPPVAETPQPNPYFGRKSFRGGEAAPAAPEAGPAAAAPEAAPEAPPVQTRTQMGSRLKELRRAAEAFIVPTEAEGDLAKALQQIDRVVKGVAVGSPDAFQARYVDALERLARALEDEPFAEDILADVLGELDSRPSARASVDIDEAASAARRKEVAAIYDNTLAEREFLGKGKAPLGPTASAAVGGTAGIGALSMAAWLADADDDTVAAAGAFGAALGVALGVVTGKARLRSWEVNSPGIAIFLGPESPGANKKLLAKASELEARGTDRDVIWKETGWGRGPSGGWVYEADEPMGELIDDLLGENIPIPEALKGKRLFEAEPELRSVLLQTRQLLAEMKELGDETGMFVEGLASDVGEIAVNRNLSRADKLRILIHELNHAGQTKRGMGFGDETTSDLRTYLTNAAEAESRLAEARMGLSRKERLNRPPWKDYDVPEDDLWSATTTARAASLGSDLRRFRDDAWFDQNVKQGTFEDGELAGYQYYRSDEAGVTAWVEDLGDGEGSWNWDWNENLDNGTIFSDNPNASPAQSARAFAFAQASFERLTAGGKFDVLTFEGLKKPTKEGQAASGHERVQEFLMARGNTPGYVPSKGSWKTKVKDPETGEMIEVTRSSFAFSKEGMDLDEVWQGIRRGKVEVTPIEQAKPKVAASRRYEDPNAESRAAQPADEYTGLEDARFIDYDPAYLPRRFSQKGWQRVISSPQFRNNIPKLGARLGEVIYRTNSKAMDELAASRPTPISGQDLALRMGKQYVNTVADLMSGKSGPKFRKVSMDSREAAKEAVRESLAKGDLMGFETEDAMELLLDLIAPIRKNSAEVKNFRPRVDMQLDAELDADFIDMFEWNAESLFMEYSRTMSGYAGLLRAGFRSEAELDRQIDDIIERSKFDPKRKNRAEKEVENLKLLKQSILGQPEEDLMKNKEWTWLANQMRRLNYGNLMNNTGFLAISEALGAVNQVGIARMFTMFPEFQRYYKLARAGDPAARDNIFYLADATMGHGAAQVRSRLGQTNRFDVEENSIRDELQGVKGEIDKFTRKQANLVGRLSGMAPMQEYFRMVIVTAEAQDWVKAARKGKPLYSANRMRAMGVDDAMWQRISTQLRKWGDTQSPDTRRSLPEMDLNVWDDKEALNAWINALDRNANRLVMEGDAGHIPFWLRNRPAAQLIFQFLNFPINAFSKHMGFAIKTADARAAGEFLAMSLGGAVGVMARVQATAWSMDTEEERKAYLEERFTLAEFGKALMYYNAHSSLAPNILDLGLYAAEQAGVPNPIPGFEGQTVKPLFTNTRGSGLPGNPLASNPSITRIERTPKVLGALATGTPFSEQDVAGVVKHFSPLGNHIAMNALLDRIFEFLPDEEGSVEDQVQN